MPRRSTLIQRVIFQIQKQLASDAEVEESASLLERSSGLPREVDIVVRRTVGEHELLIAVECRDHRRKATVEWVEQMAMKHAALPTSKLVLFSRSGFPRAATAKAHFLGIDTYSLGAASENDWSSLLGENAASPLVIWALRIKGCWLVLQADEHCQYPAHPNTAIFNADGTVEGELRQIIYSTIDHAADFTQAALEFASRVKQPEFLANLGREPPMFVRNGPDQLQQVAGLRVLLEAVELPGRFHLHEARYRGSPVAYGEATSPAGRLTLSLIQPRAGEPTGAVSIVDPASGAVSSAEVRFPSKPGKLRFVTGPVRVPPGAA